MNHILKSAVAVLVLVALFLGYRIYQVRFAQPGGLASIDKSSGEEKGQVDYRNAIAASVPTDTVDVTLCKPSPENALVKKGESITFVNKGDRPRTLYFGSGESLEVAAGSSSRLVPAFERGPGSYGYGCDLSTAAVGRLVLNPQPAI